MFPLTGSPIQLEVFVFTFILCLITGLLLIPVLRRLKFGQKIRTCGPATHLKKQGVPTIGGLLFLIPVFIVCSIYSGKYTGLVPLLLTTLGFAAVGLIDDYVKIKINKEGLSPRQKSFFQFIVTIAFTFYVYRYTDLLRNIKIPFLNAVHPLLYACFIAALLYFTTNAVNLTDGVDGLCAGVSFIIFSLFVLVAASGAEWEYVRVFAAAMAGGCLGFLVFNHYPAKIIMGDTGSLALGGAVTAIAVMLRMPLILFVAGAVYMVEALSVILQVAFFKARGRRIFKMAPIHHHFELSGWRETKVVWVFYSITAVLCGISLFLLNIL